MTDSILKALPIPTLAPIVSSVPELHSFSERSHPSYNNQNRAVHRYPGISDPKNIRDRTCYGVNIYDQRKDPTYGTGAIVRHVEVDPMPKAGGKWNTYEITVKGRDIALVLNGEKTAELRSGLFTEEPFALQHGAGVIKFRKVAVKPL